MKPKVAARAGRRPRAKPGSPVPARLPARLARLLPRDPQAAPIPADLRQRLARMAPEYPVRVRNERLLVQLMASAPVSPAVSWWSHPGG